MRATADEIARAPKVLLHDHLDGGLRPQTVIELADAIGHELPTTDANELGMWFRAAADSGSLERYLETFSHTVAVMQTREALIRIATECVEDLAADGVVYAEVRYAPEQHLESGMSLLEVVDAVEEGFRNGERRAADAGRHIRVGTLLCAMRHAANSMEIADLVISSRDQTGVLGFDIAGAEAGFPPIRHLDAFQRLRRENSYFTIHAGEAVGLPSIWEAIQCGADRLGHGVRIVDDIEVGPDGTVQLGRLASYVRDKRIALEMCPSSNVQTGAVSSIADHPIGLLTRLRFRVTVNTDNRLMSGTSMSRELTLLSEAFGYDLEDLCWFTVNAMKSAFLPYDQRLALIDSVVRPGYAALSARRAFAQVKAPVSRDR